MAGYNKHFVVNEYSGFTEKKKNFAVNNLLPLDLNEVYFTTFKKTETHKNGKKWLNIVC